MKTSENYESLFLSYTMTNSFPTLSILTISSYKTTALTVKLAFANSLYPKILSLDLFKNGEIYLSCSESFLAVILGIHRLNLLATTLPASVPWAIWINSSSSCNSTWIWSCTGDSFLSPSSSKKLKRFSEMISETSLLPPALSLFAACVFYCIYLIL